MADKLLAGAPATIAVELRDQHGELTAPAGTVTVAVERADGTDVLAAGTATVVDGAARTVALTAAQTASLDVLVATWKDGTDVRAVTYHEVVGAFYFAVSEARASDPSLVDETRYPNAEVRRARAAVEDEFERILGFALVPRYGRARLYSPTNRVVLPHQFLRRVTAVRSYASLTSYTDLTVADLGVAADEYGIATREDGVAWGTVVVAYEHGLDSPPPDLLAAAFARVRARLNMPKSGIPDRAERYQAAEGGTYVLSMPGTYKTGQPEVDGVLDGHHRRPIPVG